MHVFKSLIPRLVVLAGLALVAGPVAAQTQKVSSSTGAGKPLPKPIVKKPKPLSTAISGGLRFNSNGWGLYGEYGKMLSDEGRDAEKFFDTRIFTVGFDEVKHPKEMRAPNKVSNGENPKPYIYGKVNNFYSLKLGYGFRKMIAGKPEGGTVSVHWVYQGGLALGLEKPYYLDAYAPQDNGHGPLVRQTVKYSDANSAYFLNNNYIIGSAGFTQGIGETKIIPGIHARTGLHFDFSQRRKLVMALDCGIAAEYYTRKIQIMASQTDRPYFVNLYAGIQFGVRK